MKRFLGTAAAVLVIVVGAALVALGALGIAVFGVQGVTSGPSTTLESADESLAIVADLERVDVGFPFAELIGSATLTVSGAGESMFVATADQAAVDTYLFGVPYDLASKNGTWQLNPVPGIETTAADPQAQTFWLDESVGLAAEIALPTQDQPTTLVIMNADGTPGVDALLVLGFGGAKIFPFAVGAIAAGMALIGIAVALLVRTGRRRRHQRVAVVDIADDASVSTFFNDAGALASDDRSE